MLHQWTLTNVRKATQINNNILTCFVNCIYERFFTVLAEAFARVDTQQGSMERCRVGFKHSPQVLSAEMLAAMKDRPSWEVQSLPAKMEHEKLPVKLREGDHPWQGIVTADKQQKMVSNSHPY